MAIGRSQSTALFIGVSRAGKSALLRTLCDDKAEFDANYVATKDVNTLESADGQTFSEIGGSISPMYATFTQILYQQTHKIIFVLDLTQDFAEQLAYFRKCQQKILPGTTCVLVATKNDMSEKCCTDANIAACKAEFNIQEHFFCSVKDRENIGVVRQYLATPKQDHSSVASHSVSADALSVVPLQILEIQLNTEICLLTPNTNDKEAVEKCEKQKLAIALRCLQEKIQADVHAKKMTPEEGDAIRQSAIVLAQHVRGNSCTLNHVEEFQQVTKHLQTNWSWRVVLGAVIGAVIGSIVGAMLGAWTGPVAAVPALFCGVKGALIGASLCGAVGAVGGGVFGMWHTHAQHPSVQVAQAARTILVNNLA